MTTILETATVELFPTQADDPLSSSLDRRWTDDGVDPLEQVDWERRDARIEGSDGNLVFEQLDVEVPATWSQTACDVVVSKYFRGALGSPERETSVRQLIQRVVGRIHDWALADGVVADETEAEVLRDELAWLLVHQRAAFNSPVWFNVGVDRQPQCSACFINSVEDTMESILDLAKTEAMLFKHGSGSGSNLSSLRGSNEKLSGGGTASGPVSFLRGLDAFAGVIKSGGKTRRAAKMVVLDVDHPDIGDFIQCKLEEERKAHALIAAGWEAGIGGDGGAYSSVFFQNANHSIRLTDDFLAAVEENAPHVTYSVTDGTPMGSFEARELFRQMAEAAWTCGDPGFQYEGEIQRWHTCPTAGRIRASNPCSEFLFLDDTACNLASLNLLSFDDPDSGFDAEGFRHACRILLTAQETLVDRASYPTDRIRDMSIRFRPLGLGYANLGALLMARGLAYDSDDGRRLASSITALMTGAAYERSAELAERLGPFPAYDDETASVLDVLARHREALSALAVDPSDDLGQTAHTTWDEAILKAELHGVRNAQVTALAPTGTIAFMMDCDTTGVEPELALVKYKKLVGGGSLRLVNRTVDRALIALGYPPAEVSSLVEQLADHGNPESLDGLREEHLPVFDCAFRAEAGSRVIEPGGHLRMLAAIQPFISGGISKTINLPHEATVEEVEEVILEGWRLKLKAIALYRDGCKAVQPLSTSSGKKEPSSEAAESSKGPAAVRRRLPAERAAITHKFSIDAHEGYVTVGLYEDGLPGEIFVVMAKEGSTISGMMDAFATSISLALQYGVPLSSLIEKFSHCRFEPSGFTSNRSVPYAKSIIDYIFRWLASKFLDAEGQTAAGVVGALSGATATVPNSAADRPKIFFDDAPSCHVCGAIMVRNGSCYSCRSCGSTTGCG